MQFDIRRFDIYRKVPKDLTQPTFTGACISIASILFIMFLMTSELFSFLRTERMSEIFVDDASGPTIPVNINVTFPNLHCDYLGLDIQDQNGRHEVGYHGETEKVMVNHENGCRFEGVFYINKVPGNFHLSMHSAQEIPNNPDMTHIIHYLYFGNASSSESRSFSSLENIDVTDANSLATHDYIIKVVPTLIVHLDGSIEDTFQYSYAHKDYVTYNHAGFIMPTVWFKYDLSPIKIKYTEKRKPLYHFITTFCAIIGGTFTVSGIIDALIFTAHEVFKKAELGKLS